MGFAYTHAVAALEANGSNVERAADWLLAGRAQHLPAGDAPPAEAAPAPEPEAEAAHVEPEPEPEPELEAEPERVGAEGWYDLLALFFICPSFRFIRPSFCLTFGQKR